MSSKSKKRQVNEWVKCIKCKVFLLTRETNLHDDDACRTTSNFDTIDGSDFKLGHAFVKNGIVCGTTFQLKNDPEILQRLPYSKKKNIVFIHPTAMKFAGIAIGDNVLLKSDKTNSTVLSAWPSTAIPLHASGKHPLSIILGPYNRSPVPKDHISIISVFSLPEIDTKSILLKPVCRHDFHSKPEFKSYLLNSLDGCAFTSGSTVQLTYFGQQCKLKVIEVINEKDDRVVDSFSFNESMSISALNLDKAANCSIDQLNFSALSLNSTSGSTIATSTPKKINDELKFDTKRFVTTDPSSENFIQKHHNIIQCSYSFIRSFTDIKIVDEIDKNKSLKKDQPIGVTFRDIGALNSQVSSILEVFKMSSNRNNLQSYSFKLPKNILLFGPPGTGKTMIGRAIAHEMEHEFVVINGPEVYSKYLGETETNLRNIFKEARLLVPCVIFIDEIDALCPKRNGNQTEQEKRVVSTVLTQLDDISNSSLDIIVIAATNKPDSLDSAIRRPGRLDKEIEIGIPDIEGRYEILTKMLSRVQHSLNSEEVKSVAEACHGYTGADLSAICAEAGAHSLKMKLLSINKEKYAISDAEISSVVKITFEDMKFGQKCIKPSVMREIRLEITKVYWNDIGGLEDLKKKLKQAVEWPIKHPEAFRRMGIRPPCGILMYGPPGCSKTMIAKALATESGLNFFSIKGPELFSKWVGESERAVREVFRKSRAASPAIIFFDEIDVLASERGSSSGGTNVGDRVLTQLLTEMDGVEYLNNVVVVAATNRPDMIDKALMRPGRLDRVIYVPLPDKESRKKIFEIQFRKTPVSSDVSIEDLAERTNSYSGAELVSVCQEACLLAMEEDLEVKNVSNHFFNLALEAITPRIKPELIQFYEKFQNCNNRS